MGGFIMALSKKEKLEIKQAYEKEWKNYLRRIKKAESQGLVIPENRRYQKVKNPTSWKTVEKLKAVNARTIRRDSTARYVNAYGDVVSKDEAVTTRSFEKFKPWLGSTIKERNRTQAESHPVTFDEYIKIAEETADVREKFDLSNPTQKAAYDEIVLSRVREMRGPFFDEELFIANEEKTHGYFGRDANEPLDPAERDYIRRKLRDKDIDEDDEYSYQKEVEKLRSPLSNYDPETQMYHEERADFPTYSDDEIDDWNGGYVPETNIENEWAYNREDIPEEVPEHPKTEISATLLETYAYNALYSMVSELVLNSNFAQRSQAYFLNQLEVLASIYDPKPLNDAIKQIAGENGELFNVELLYKTGQLAQYLFRLERLIVQLTMASDEWKKDHINEAEANFNEYQERFDEIEV